MTKHYYAIAWSYGNPLWRESDDRETAWRLGEYRRWTSRAARDAYVAAADIGPSRSPIPASSPDLRRRASYGIWREEGDYEVLDD